MAYGGFGNRGNRGGGFGGGGGFRRNFGPREMHKIKCSECGKEAEVPFKPRKDTPVYCRECFFKKKGITPREPRREEPEEVEESEDADETEDSKESESEED